MELGFDKNQAIIALKKNVNYLTFRNLTNLKLSNGCSIVVEMFHRLKIC
jgi:hypothetical protein